MSLKLWFFGKWSEIITLMDCPNEYYGQSRNKNLYAMSVWHILSVIHPKNIVKIGYMIVILPF